MVRFKYSILNIDENGVTENEREEERERVREERERPPVAGDAPLRLSSRPSRRAFLRKRRIEREKWIEGMAVVRLSRPSDGRNQSHDVHGIEIGMTCPCFIA